MGAARVVAPDSLLRRAADVQRVFEEVRVGAGRGIDDRPAPVDELELVVIPVSALGSLVLAVADRDGLAVECLAGVAGVEDELDVLPVALVQVVPVVVDVEEPVLKHELPGALGVGRDVGVGRRGASLGHPTSPALVVAPRAEGVTREVEVVVVEPDDAFGLGRDLDEVGGIPRPAQRDGRLVEEVVHVDRLVRLPRPAFLGLLDEAHDRGISLRERDLVGEVSRRRRRHDERDHGEAGEGRRVARAGPLTASLDAAGAADRSPRHRSLRRR